MAGAAIPTLAEVPSQGGLLVLSVTLPYLFGVCCIVFPTPLFPGGIWGL